MEYDRLGSDGAKGLLQNHRFYGKRRAAKTRLLCGAYAAVTNEWRGIVMKLSVKVPHALCGPAQRPSAAVLVRRFRQYEARFRTSLLVFFVWPFWIYGGSLWEIKKQWLAVRDVWIFRSGVVIRWYWESRRILPYWRGRAENTDWRASQREFLYHKWEPLADLSRQSYEKSQTCAMISVQIWRSCLLGERFQ